MNTPEKMFTLDSVDTRVTQPLNQRVIQQGPDTRARDQQMATGVASFSKALGNLATYRKERQIENDISLAQEAAVRNEVMPGGLLPIAQRAFRDTQDIETSTNVYNEIELFTEGEEVRSIVNNPQLTPVQKNSKINKAIDRVYYTSASSIQNVKTRSALKSKVDGLKVKGMKDVWNIDKNQKYGIALNAVSGKINEGFDSSFDPRDIFTGKWVNTVAQQLKTSLPWVNIDDAKVSIFSMLAQNENMITESNVMFDIMQSEFSKGVTFSALADSKHDAGAEINKVYQAYLRNVEKHYSDEDKAEREAIKYQNDTALDEAFDMADQIELEKDTNPNQYGQRFEIIKNMMRDKYGADYSVISSFINTYNRVDDATANGIDSTQFQEGVSAILNHEITSGASLLNFVNSHQINNKGYGRLNTFLSSATEQIRKGRDAGRKQVSEINASLKSVIKAHYKPDSVLEDLLTSGMADPSILRQELRNKDSQLYKGLTKPKFEGTEFLAAMIEFADVKIAVEAQIDDRVYEHLKSGAKPEDLDFTDILTDWKNKSLKISQNIENLAITTAGKLRPENVTQGGDKTTEQILEEDKTASKEAQVEEAKKNLEAYEKETKEALKEYNKDETKEVIANYNDWPDGTPMWVRKAAEASNAWVGKKALELKESLIDFEIDLWPDEYVKAWQQAAQDKIDMVDPNVPEARKEELLKKLNSEAASYLEAREEGKKALEKEVKAAQGDKPFIGKGEWRPLEDPIGMLKDMYSGAEQTTSSLVDTGKEKVKLDEPRTRRADPTVIRKSFGLDDNGISDKQYSSALDKIKLGIGIMESRDGQEVVQRGGGRARGYYQYEPESARTAITRLKNKGGKDFGDQLDFSKLSKEDQDILFEADHSARNGSSAGLAKVVNATNKDELAKALAEYWANVHKVLFLDENGVHQESLKIAGIATATSRIKDQLEGGS